MQEEDVTRAVIFVGPMEHHSNLLVWKEKDVDVVRVNSVDDGRLDLEHLKELLQSNKERPLMIGSFTAASNVTGVIERVNEVTVLLHEHGALAFWDYAAAAPHCHLDMNPRSVIKTKL